MEEFNNSLPVDKVLIEEDIIGSIAWANALMGTGVFSEAEARKICEGLRSILDDARADKIKFNSSDEDIHMAVERILIERIGDAGARLHTGRSRNDQVVTDVRLYVKKAMIHVQEQIRLLQKALFRRVEADREIVIPGYTHLQQAQPVYLAHYWLSFLFALQRDRDRCDHAIVTADIMPLGSGAMAGSGFNVDRDKLAADLGFSRISANSIDGVASRDFILESLSAIVSIGLLLSRYAEDLIIWSSREFRFVELDDAWSTGSSMMPQKKNPDSLELIRGKTGRFIGNYTRFAATLKGVGLTYYKDLQEDKEPMFDSVNQICLSLQVFARVVDTLFVNADAIKNDLDPFLAATDLADYLVKKGMPFRQAHKVIGKIVSHCVKSSQPFDKLPLAKLREFSELFTEDVRSQFAWETILANRNIAGGTGPKSLRAQIVAAKKLLKE